MPSRYLAVVVGYGPFGRTLTQLLRANGIQPTTFELNLETVRPLREEGVSAVYGDAMHKETLKSAGVANAASIILSSSDVHGAAEVIRLARELNPEIHVLARSAYLRERQALRKAGANDVFSGEGEVALAMTEFILRDLGATPEQIDRERQRLGDDLLGRLQESSAPTVEPQAASEGQSVLKKEPVSDEGNAHPETGDPGKP